MKKISKQIIALALLMGLILSSLSPMVALAADDGSITVDNPKEGQTYNLYRVFDLIMSPDVADTGSTPTTTYQYTAVNTTLETSIKGKYPQLNSGKTSGGKMVINTKPLTNVDYEEDDGSGTMVNKYINPYDFSNWLSGLAEGNFTLQNPPIEADQAGNNVKWENLPLGYYMVKSSLGSLVSLNTTDKDVKIHEKNPDSEVIKLTKLVKGGVNGDATTETQNNGWVDKTYANIGETLEYKITFNVHAYANKEYVLEDVIPKGITLISTEPVVELQGENDPIQPGDANYPYTVNSSFVEDTGTNKKNLKITFPENTIQAIAKTLRADKTNVENNTADANTDVKTITITYSAKLNNESQVSNHDGINKNTNTVTLIYDTGKNLEKSVDVNTTDFNIFKFKETDTALADAKFKIYTEKTGVTALGFVQKGTEQVYNYEGTTGNTEIKTDDTGKFNIRGLRPGTYWIEETVAPTGYNKIQDRIELVIKEDAAANPATKIKYTAKIEGNTADLIDNTVKIENQKGAELPETGGMGRTLIYTLGAIIFFGSLVLLIARKRTKQDNA